MIFRSCCCNPKMIFTTGSLETYTGNSEKNQIIAIGSLSVGGARRRRSGRRSSTVSGPRADLHLHGPIWGGSRAWDVVDRRRRRAGPRPAAAALLVRHPAARCGPLVVGLAMGAEGEAALSAGTTGSAPRRRWPCRQRWRGQGAVTPCSASAWPGAVAPEKIRRRARRRERGRVEEG
jgi:hypothetical protein